MKKQPDDSEEREFFKNHTFTHRRGGWWWTINGLEGDDTSWTGAFPSKKAAINHAKSML